MMNEVASGSLDGVSFWDSKTFSLKRRVDPFPDCHFAPSSLSWCAKNNQRLLVAPHDGDKLALLELQEQQPVWKYLKHKDGPDAVNFRCGCFMQNSRYVVAGCTSPQVHLWDTQTQEVVKTYQGHTAPISAVTRTLKDSHIVSGADNGQILLHNAKSSQLLANLTKDHRDRDSSSKQAITQLAFSYHDISLIGSCGEDGSVCLWSTESQRLLTKFSQKHAGPATDLCFSPYNKLFMISAGTDSKITCYDIQQRKSVTQITTPVALSSVAVLRDGMTFIGGGTDGKLYVYEMRNVKSPRQVVEAHQSAVTCISEQLPLKTSASKGASKDSGALITSEAQKQEQDSELSSEGLVVHTPFIPTSYPNRKADPLPADIPKLVMQTPVVRDGKMAASATPAFNAGTPGIFSPLESDASKLQSNRTTATVPPTLRGNEPVLVPNPGASSIFSPLVAGEVWTGPPASAVQSSTSVARVPLLPPVTTVGSSTVSTTTRPLALATTSGTPVPSATSQAVPPLPASSVATVQTATTAAAYPSQQLDDTEGTGDELGHLMRSASNGQSLSSSSSLNLLTLPSQYVGAPAIQVQYIEGLIKDTAEELSFAMHRDIRALSLDMFRQFFIQQQQLTAAVASLNEKLEKLSVENQRLHEQLQQFMPKH